MSDDRSEALNCHCLFPNRQGRLLHSAYVDLVADDAAGRNCRSGHSYLQEVAIAVGTKSMSVPPHVQFSHFEAHDQVGGKPP